MPVEVNGNRAAPNRTGRKEKEKMGRRSIDMPMSIDLRPIFLSMHNNPVKRGYLDDPLHWRYSSARNYAGLQVLVDVVTAWM